MLLPACDGDVTTLQGANFFENAKYDAGAGGFAKIQWYVQGTNHNFFNTTWTGDDFSNATDPACSRGLPPRPLACCPPISAASAGPDERLPAPLRRQRDEVRPAHDRRGDAARAAAPLSSGKGGRGGPDQLRRPRGTRFDLLRPNSIPDPQPDPATGGTPTPFDATLTTTTAARRADHHERAVERSSVCNPNDLAWRQGPTLPDGLPAVPGAGRSTAPRATSSRSRGTLQTGTCGRIWPAPEAAVDISRFGVLDLRAAMNRDRPAQPGG